MYTQHLLPFNNCVLKSPQTIALNIQIIILAKLVLAREFRLESHFPSWSQVVGLLLLSLLARHTYVQAACFEGSFVNDTWFSAGCRIPEPERAAGQCLVAKNLLFMGGSTTRNIFYTLCARLKVEVQHHPCNMYMGWGCHDCNRGCRFPPNPNWQDAYARTASGTQVTFSWKPEMLTTDDIIFLKRFTGSGNNMADAVIVHKGIHEAVDWQQQHKANNYTYHDFELEMRARAEILAETLREHFPNAALFWRDAFYNGKDAELEEINSKLRPVIQARFRQQGFHILPGHQVSMTAEEYHESDGLHPHESVNDVMISMIAGVLCP